MNGPTLSPPPPPPGFRGSDMKRLFVTLAAALAATLVAAPVWAAQNTSGEARVWLEYKGPQVLDACDPGMPSTESAVNVEAFGGFFEPDSTTGLIQARVQFSPHDVLETARPGETGWDDLGPYPNGQITTVIQKGDNIIRFRQKASSYAPMPTSERRTVRVSLVTPCSDCAGAPGGMPINSQRQIFNRNPPVAPRPYGCVDVDLNSANALVTRKCSDGCPNKVFSHNQTTGCRVRVQAPGAETYTWENCSTTMAGTGDNKYCNTVQNRRSDPVCDGAAVYTCTPPTPSGASSRDNTAHYRVLNNPRAIFEVQYNGYGCD